MKTITSHQRAPPHLPSATLDAPPPPSPLSAPSDCSLRATVETKRFSPQMSETSSTCSGGHACPVRCVRPNCWIWRSADQLSSSVMCSRGRTGTPGSAGGAWRLRNSSRRRGVIPLGLHFNQAPQHASIGALVAGAVTRRARDASRCGIRDDGDSGSTRLEAVACSVSLLRHLRPARQLNCLKTC